MQTQETHTDGQGHGQGEGGNLPLEDDHRDDNLHEGEGAPEVDETVERLENLDARIDLIDRNVNQGLARINQQLANLGRPQMSKEELEAELGGDDDGEPLTGRKVAKIVNQAVSTAVNQSTQMSSRERWDAKLREEFPIKDARFEAEFSRQWDDFQQSGGNINHPKAAYTIGKTTARVLGLDKPAPQKRQSEAPPSGEPPTSGNRSASRRTSQSQGQMVGLDDPRLDMYRLRHDDGTPQMEKFRKRLFAKDETDKKRRNRRRRA